MGKNSRLWVNAKKTTKVRDGLWFILMIKSSPTVDWDEKNARVQSVESIPGVSIVKAERLSHGLGHEFADQAAEAGGVFNFSAFTHKGQIIEQEAVIL